MRIPHISVVTVGFMFLASPGVGRGDTNVETAESIGIAPLTLATAGATALQGSTILSAIGAASSEVQDLSEARAQLAARVRELAALRDLLSQSPGDENLRSQIAAASTATSSARALVRVDEDRVTQAALADIPADLAARIGRCRAACWRRVPAEFWVVERSEEQWAALQKAIAAERRHVRQNEPFSENDEQLLATTRSDAAVLQASIAISQQLEALKVVFHP